MQEDNVDVTIVIFDCPQVKLCFENRPILSKVRKKSCALTFYDFVARSNECMKNNK